MSNEGQEFTFDEENLDLYMDEFEEFEEFNADSQHPASMDDSPSKLSSLTRKESSKTLKKPTMGTVVSKEEQKIQAILKAESERVQGLLSLIKLEKIPYFTIFEQTPFGANENGETIIQSLKFGTLLSNAGVQAPAADDVKEVGTNTPKKAKQEEFGAQVPEDRYLIDKNKKDRTNLSVLEKIRNDFGTSASFKKFVNKVSKVCDRVLTVNDILFGNDLENSKNSEIHHSKIEFSLNSFSFSHESLTKTRNLQDFFVTGNSQLVCAYSKCKNDTKSMVSYPGMIIIWSLTSQSTPEKILVSFSEISCVSYFTNQKSEFVVAGTKDGTINVWDISSNSLENLESFATVSESSADSGDSKELQNEQKFVEIMEEKVVLTNGKEKFSKTSKKLKIFLRLPSYTTDWMVYENHKSDVRTIIPTISPFQKDDLQFYSIDSNGLIIFWALSLVSSATETILGGFSLSDVLSSSSSSSPLSTNNYTQNFTVSQTDLGFGTFQSHVKLSKLAIDNLFENSTFFDYNIVKSFNCDPRKRTRYYIGTDFEEGIIFSHSRFERENLPPKLYKPFDFGKEVLEGTYTSQIHGNDYPSSIAFIPFSLSLDSQSNLILNEKIPSFFFSCYSNGVMRLFRTDYEYPLMEYAVLEGNTPIAMMFHPVLGESFLFVLYLSRENNGELFVAVLKLNFDSLEKGELKPSSENENKKISLSVVLQQNLGKILGNESKLKNASFFMPGNGSTKMMQSSVQNAKVHLVLGFENGEVQFHEVDKNWSGFGPKPIVETK